MVSDAAVDGISGAIGGMVALTATYPLSTINTLQSVAGKKKTAKHLPGDTQASHKPVSKLGEIVEICRECGWRGLFAGIQPSLLGTAVSQGVYFYLYSGLRQMAVNAANSGRPAQVAGRGKADIGVAASLLVAALAGCGNTLLTIPIWVVATRTQATRTQVRLKPAQASGPGSDNVTEAAGPEEGGGPLAVARQVYQESGIKGFWRGVVPALIMVCNPTVQYMLYEWLLTRRNRKRAAQRMGPSKPSALEVFYYASLAKLGATLGTYPLLLVKTRMQSGATRAAAAADAAAAGGDVKAQGQKCSGGGTLHTIRSVYRNEGLLGFYAGMHTKILQSILAAALLFLTKEELTGMVRRALTHRSSASVATARQAAVALATAR